MQKRLSDIIDIVVRSIVFVIINYLLVSAELSFKTSILGLLASLSNIWIIIDYFRAVQAQTKSKAIAILLCSICFIANSVIAYYVGYIKGIIVSF